MDIAPTTHASIKRSSGRSGNDHVRDCDCQRSTVLGQNAWLPVVRALGMEPWFGGRLMVSRANGVFDETGAMTDDGFREQLQRFISGFEDFTRSFA